MFALFFIVIFWVLPIVVGHRIGSNKGRMGWLWGLLLGWIGVIIVACLSPADEKVCPQCAEKVKRGAQVCHHCSYRFIPASHAGELGA